MSREIDDLSIVEAKQIISNCKIEIQKLQIKNRTLQSELNYKMESKKKLKEDKSKKLREAQDQIKREKSPSLIETKRKRKEREKESFDKRIEAITSKVSSIKNEKKKNMDEISRKKNTIEKIKILINNKAKQLNSSC